MTDSDAENEAFASFFAPMGRPDYVLNAFGGSLTFTQDEEEGGLGGRVWKSAPYLASFIEQTVPQVGTMNILELGTGTGALGLALALSGARVTLTDRGNMIGLTRDNVKRNAAALPDAGARVTVRELDWTAFHAPAWRDESFDLVVMADCVYHDHLYAPLLEVLRGLRATSLLMCNDDTRTTRILANGERWDASWLRQCAASNVVVEIVPASEAHANSDMVLQRLTVR